MDYVPKTQPFAHQITGFDLSKDAESFAYLMEMGTGKSKLTIDVMAYNYTIGRVEAFFVLAPNGVQRNWIANEITAHLPDGIERRAVFFNPDGNKKQMAAQEALFEPGPGLRVLAMNIEAINTPRGLAMAKRFLKAFKCFMAVDESSRIKTHNAKRTINVVNIGGMAVMRRILTGTPITQSPMDLYSQYMFLDPKIFGQSSFYGFQARYAEMRDPDDELVKHIRNQTGHRDKDGKWVMGRVPMVQKEDEEGNPIYKNMGELHDLMAPHTYRVLKTECLDLPEKIYKRAYVNMPPSIMKAYRELAKRGRVEFMGGELNTTHRLTLLLRLQQLLGGLFVHDEGEVVIADDPRREVLLEVLEEINPDVKVIIWARFTRELDLIQNVLVSNYGIESTVRYDGTVSDDDRLANVSAFQKSPVTRFFIGQAKAGGIGLTLTAATVMIYYSNSFDLEERLQSEDRAHRIGQKSNVTYVDIECVGTVDTHIINSLRAKKNIADEVLRDDVINEWLKESE